MILIPLESVAEQSVFFQHRDDAYEIFIQVIRNVAVANVSINKELKYSGLRIAMNAPILPIDHVVNFKIWSANDSSIDYERFGKSQVLYACFTCYSKFNIINFLAEEANAITKE